VPDTLTLQNSSSHSPQFAINARRELPQRFRVAAGPSPKQLRGVGAGLIRHLALSEKYKLVPSENRI